VLNVLQRGVRCVVTTRDRRIIAGRFRGIEVGHGERAVLIESTESTHSVPVEWLLTVSVSSSDID
jgi:hypothetical protein